MAGKDSFLNVVLERDRKDQLDRSCENLRNAARGPRRKGRSYIKWKGGRLIGFSHILRKNCPLKHFI
jgi:hypothetical protein